MNQPTKIAIIGAGKVGQSIAQLASKNGIENQLIGRDVTQQRNACQESDLILLTVNDNKIKALCDRLALSFKTGATVAHCSGALSSSILESAERAHCFTASLHLLNTFPSIDTSLSLLSDLSHGTYLYAEGNGKALNCALPIFQQLGFNTVELKSESKTAYHLACVFACNYLTALIDLSLLSAESAGLDQREFWHAIQPLIQNTLRNLEDSQPSDALSGPIARGDTITVQQHIALLRGDVDKLADTKANDTPNSAYDSYLALGRHALTLASQRGELSNETLAQLNLILIDS